MTPHTFLHAIYIPALRDLPIAYGLVSAGAGWVSPVGGAGLGAARAYPLSPGVMVAGGRCGGLLRASVPDRLR